MIATICVTVVGLLIITLFILSPKQGAKRIQGNKQKSKKKSPAQETIAKPAASKVKLNKPPQEIINVAPAPEIPASDRNTASSSPTLKKTKAKETPEQRAARLERQKIAKAQKSNIQEEQPKSATTVESANLPALKSPIVRPVAADGWAVVEKPKAKKPKETVKTEVHTAPAQNDSTKKQVTVDSKKIGVIIGPKGSVMRSIQELTGVEITLPAVGARPATGPTIVTLSGTAEAVSRASAIVTDLCNKGYSAQLAGEDFQESAVTVHPMYLPEIIGKNGACIRAIQDQLGVRLMVPQGIGRDHPSKVKIAVAGPKEQVAAAKVVLHEIQSVYHSEITHPGVVHVEIDVPERMFNFIIGPKGSEIRHIENNFKVSVFIPNADSLNKSVVVVGPPVGVESSERYIRKIISQVGTEESAAAEVMQGWTDVADPVVDAETDEPWMSEYMYDRSGKNAQTAVPIVEPSVVVSAPANAWGSVSAAEGW